jgi:uncharacterized protein (DUF2147 family)
MESDPDNVGVENNLLIKTMKKTLLMVATTMATLAVAAQPAAVDTVTTVALSELEVLGTRASENTPVAFTNVTGKQLVSYFGQVGYFNDKTSLRFVTYGGKEDTYHAWDGISRDDLKNNRTYNPNGEIKHDGKVAGFYKDQKDTVRPTTS